MPSRIHHALRSLEHPGERGVVCLAGHDLVVTMGEPIEVPQEVCDKCRAGGTLTRAAWADITALVQQSLVDLEARSPPNVNQPARERKPDPGPTPA